MRASAALIVVMFAIALGCVCVNPSLKTCEKPGPGSMAPAAQPPKAPEMAKTMPACPVDELESLQATLKDVRFDYNKYEILKSDVPKLKTLAKILTEHPELGVRIEGNCDERGTEEYNLALGVKRANAAKDYLTEKLGVPEMKIRTSSNGKDKPICEEHNEKCWAKNRRDELILTQ